MDLDRLFEVTIEFPENPFGKIARMYMEPGEDVFSLAKKLSEVYHTRVNIHMGMGIRRIYDKGEIFTSTPIPPFTNIDEWCWTAYGKVKD